MSRSVYKEREKNGQDQKLFWGERREDRKRVRKRKGRKRGHLQV